MEVSESRRGVILLEEELEVSEICGEEPMEGESFINSTITTNKPCLANLVASSHLRSHCPSWSNCQSGRGQHCVTGRGPRGAGRSTWD